MTMVDTMTTYGTYTIPAHNAGRLSEEVERLNRRAEKLGVAKIAMQADAHEFRERTPNSGIMDEWITINLVGEAPVLAGYQFAAVLQHEGPGAGNIVRVIPGFTEPIPPSYRGVAPWCDHCKTKRARTDSFLVHHDTDGFKQVGSSCMKDFLGHKSPHAIAAWLQDIDALATRMRDNEDDEANIARRPVQFLSTLVVASVAAAAIRVMGWRSKAIAREQGGPATADYVHDILMSRGEYADDLRKQVVPVAGDQDKGAATLAWVRDTLSRRDLNDYESNLVIACSGEQMNVRNIAIVVSALPVYAREMSKAPVAKPSEVGGSDHVESQWLGAEGERLDIAVSVIRITRRETEDGISYTITMLDTKGNTLKWFTQRPPAKWAGEPSECTWNVRGTVVRHGEWQGRKETVLNRVMVLSEAK